MNFIKTKIEDCKIIQSVSKFDKRGFFLRSFCKKKLNFDIKQINISYNKKSGTLRGFHYQKIPSKENKIISCISGEIFNVVIDIRKKSKTYLKQFSFILKEKDNFYIHVPAGCANCYLTLKKNTKLMYFMSDFYKPKKNRGFNYQSTIINAKWPKKINIISEKDKKLPFYK